MQYKKKDINDRILEAGRNEYAEKGFRAGNISIIAENAGVPVGNLYRYFDGKTGLLDAIVKPAYTQLPDLLKELQRVQVLDAATLGQIMPVLMEKLLDFFDKYGKEIVILADKCQGTRYEDFASDLVRQVSDIVAQKLYPQPSGNELKMATYIAKAFLNSLFDLLREGFSRTEMQTMTEKLIKFYFYEVDKRK